MIEMAKRISRKIIKGQKGQVLPIVLVLLVIGGLLVAPTLHYGSTSLKGHQVTEMKAQELYAADSGVEDGLHWLIGGREVQGPWDDWDEEEGVGERDTYQINDRSVNVTVEQMDGMGPNIYKVTSVASSPDGSTTVLASVWAVPFFEDGHEFTNQDPPPEGDIHVDGDGTVENTVPITGNLTASGNITLENQSSVIGDVSVEGDLTLENQASIIGTVCCGGDITIGNNAEIIGDVYVSGNSTIRLEQAVAKIIGNIWADGNLTIEIPVNAEIEGNIYVDGDVHIYLGNPNSYMMGGGMYATGHIYIEENKGTFDYDTFEEEWDGGSPFPQPECPGMPLNPVEIFSWTIT